MYRGRIVELAPAARIFDAPAHPYTKALLSAIPQLRPGEKISRVRYDETTFARLPLREVDDGHFAAT
jgi:oligopeptide/dipeptide ABC transporter ATP-binding protein